MRRISISFTLAIAMWLHGIASEVPVTASKQDAFKEADAVNWKPALLDPCTGDWMENWFLDGEVGQVKTTPEGMVLTAGHAHRKS